MYAYGLTPLGLPSLCLLHLPSLGPNVDKMKVDQVRDSVNCRVDEVRYFVKIVDVVRVDQVRVDQVGCSHAG